MSQLFGPKTFDVPCTIDNENTLDSFHAYVELDGDIEIRPGDEVTVHGAPTSVPFGERLVVRRHATVVRAGTFERLWTRIAGNFEITELYEVGFSEGRTS
jgi:hypothetical protein